MKRAMTYCTNFPTRVSVQSVCKMFPQILPYRETERPGAVRQKPMQRTERSVRPVFSYMKTEMWVLCSM